MTNWLPSSLRAKRLFLLLLSVSLSLISLELLVPVGFRFVGDGKFSQAELRTELDAVATSAADDGIKGTPSAASNETWVRHPYLGYTANLDLRVHPPDSPLIGYSLQWMKRGPDHLVVALTGGSFAAEAGVLAGDDLVTGLEKATGRKIRFLNLALGGYKQPQQLMMLSYLLSLGAEFDLVINIDGFNEVALPPTELVPRGVFPLYPRDWYIRTAHLEGADARQLAQLESLQKSRTFWAQVFQHRPLCWSNTALVLWKSIDRALESRIAGRTLSVGKKRSSIPWEVSGPEMAFGSEEDLLQFLAEDWARCSIQMDQLCSANGAQYLHCLQPNQYVSGSKPMSEEERHVAIADDQPYGTWASKGYPQLEAVVHRLVEQKVDFHDLSMMFKNIERPLYRDNCCHLNAEGYQLVVERILSILTGGGHLERLGSPPATTSGVKYR